MDATSLKQLRLSAAAVDLAPALYAAVAASRGFETWTYDELTQEMKTAWRTVAVAFLRDLDGQLADQQTFGKALFQYAATLSRADAARVLAFQRAGDMR